MSVKLHISDHLTLPLDVVTQTIAILAKRRAGKSYTMRRLVEQLHRAGQQVVVVDPKGDQWGIRSAADGKHPGLSIVILGGERGDVPLESSGGELVAKLVVEERVSVLLDLSLFRKHELATFMAAFLENLYRMKAIEKYRTPMMLAIDEADAIAPQNVKSYGIKGGNVERMLGAAEDIVRRGGQRGIGCTLVTQRSAVLNKNVLTQAQILVALRTIAPQDLDAMRAWIDVHGTAEQCKTLMESLPSLPIGDAWFWSPGWPTTDGIFKRVTVLPIETFDSGATPRPGEKRVEPKHAADVDLDALKRQMAATIEKARADDPKLLRAEIAKLKAELAKKPAASPAKTIEVEKPVLNNGQLKKTEKVIERTESLGQKLLAEAGELRRLIAPAFAPQATPVATSGPRPSVPRPTPQVPQRKPAVGVSVGTGEGGEVKIGKCERAVLTALAQYPQGRTTHQVAVLSGYTENGLKNSLGALRSAEYITRDQPIQITDAGLAALGEWTPLPTGEELQRYWLNWLDKCGRMILGALLPEYPNGLTTGELAERTGYTVNGLKNSLGQLRSLELITRGQPVYASADFFQ